MYWRIANSGKRSILFSTETYIQWHRKWYTISFTRPLCHRHILTVSGALGFELIILWLTIQYINQRTTDFLFQKPKYKINSGFITFFSIIWRHFISYQIGNHLSGYKRLPSYYMVTNFLSHPNHHLRCLNLNNNQIISFIIHPVV